MNILTFDIEDWYNHDDYSQDFEWDKFEYRLDLGVEKILSALEDTKTKGTFMCLGWIAEKHPHIIKQIVQAGHHVGCHSYQHQLVTRFDKNSFREDLYKAKSLLQDVSGQEVNAFRVPSFSITLDNLWAFETIAELDFKYDCSVFPSHHEFGGLPLFPSVPCVIKTSFGDIKEFPICLGKLLRREIVYSGGGYFRIIPYSLLLKMAKESSYLMSYFHPSDFDPEQPRMPHLSLMRQFKNRVALRGAYEKFKHFIADIKFFSLEEADLFTDWNQVEIIDIENLKLHEKTI